MRNGVTANLGQFRYKANNLLKFVCLSALRSTCKLITSQCKYPIFHRVKDAYDSDIAKKPICVHLRAKFQQHFV